MRIKIGIDEAGRGPWAGPVFAGLVILNEDQEKLLKDSGVTDSKKVTEKKRETLFPFILQNCTYAKVKFISAKEIDRLGIYEATKELIKQLAADLNQLKLTELNISQGEEIRILIDGTFPKLELFDSTGLSLKHECIIKGDQSEPCISAASILAKVRRDAYMNKLDDKYPQYKFGKHKGYGTKLHSDLIAEFGICEEHRKSFKPIKAFL